MLRISVSSALALAVLAAPLAAFAAGPEDSAFDAFKQLCIDTGADYSAAVKVAGDNGWTDSAVGVSVPQKVTNTDKAARAKSLPDTGLLLSLTRGVATGGLIMTTCTVNSDHGSFGDLSARVQKVFGVAPLSTTDDSATFHVTGGAGAWKNVPDNAAMGAAVGGPGGLNLINVKLEDGVVILDYIKVTK
jgi:hypothetical protein